MKRKVPFLGRRVRNADGVRLPFRSINAESGKSRTVSFYVPKGDVFLWNVFVCYLSQQRDEHVNRGIMRAVRFLIQNLDYEEQRKFRLALRHVAEEDADEAKEVLDFLKEVISPDESLDKILMDRSAGMVRRRQRLTRDSLKWFGCWETYKDEFNLVDPDETSSEDLTDDNF